MNHKPSVALTCMFLLSVIVACGGSEESSQSTSSAESVSASGPSEAAQAGIAVGEEIIAEYEALVMDVAEVLKDQPDWSDAAPPLEDLREEREARMAELNTKFLALKEQDIESFGAAVSYVQDHRGEVIDKIYSAHEQSVVQYRLQKGEKDVNAFIATLPSLLDVAVNIP